MRVLFLCRFSQENDDNKSSLIEAEIGLSTNELKRGDPPGVTPGVTPGLTSVLISGCVNNIDSSTTARSANPEFQKTLPERQTAVHSSKTETSKQLECHSAPGILGNSTAHSFHNSVEQLNNKLCQQHTNKQQQQHPSGDDTNHVTVETNNEDLARDVDHWNGAKMMTSSSDVKVRFVHLNDRTYSIGGHRATNKLQWYAVKAADDDVTHRKDQQIVIYQVEGESRQRQEEQESRVIDRHDVSVVENPDASGTKLVDVDSPDELGQCLDEEMPERHRPSSAGSTRCGVVGTDTAVDGQLHQQRQMSDVNEEEPNATDSSPTSSTAKKDLREELQQLRDANERQLIAFRYNTPELGVTTFEGVLCMN